MPFPANILSLADAIGSQFLSVFFGGTVPHSTGINQMKADLIAVEQKLGIGASTPPATAAVLRRTAAGTSAWGQAQAADIVGGGAANTVARTTDGTNVAFGKAQAADIAGGGAANTVARTTDGTNVAFGKAQAADIAAGGTANRVLRTSDGASAAWNQAQPIDLAAGGVASRVIRTGDGVSAAWGQVAGSDIVGNPVLVGTVSAGSKFFPNAQTTLGFDAPVSSVAVAAGGLGTIGTNARMGLFICVDGGSGQSAIFQLQGIGNTVTLLVGNAALFDVVAAANSKVNVIYNGGSYYVHNGYATGRSLNGMFLGIGT